MKFKNPGTKTNCFASFFYPLDIQANTSWLDGIFPVLIQRYSNNFDLFNEMMLPKSSHVPMNQGVVKENVISCKGNAFQMFFLRFLAVNHEILYIFLRFLKFITIIHLSSQSRCDSPQSRPPAPHSSAATHEPSHFDLSKNRVNFGEETTYESTVAKNDRRLAMNVLYTYCIPGTPNNQFFMVVSIGWFQIST